MRHTERTFTDEHINLDGEEFFACAFERCELVYRAAGPVRMANNAFNDCHWSFAGAAATTLAFLAALYKGGGEALVEQTFENIRSGRYRQD